MIVAFLLALAADQLAATAPASPPIVAVQDSPPPVITPRIAIPVRAEQQPAIPIEVRISAGNRLLYSDTLRVARAAGANYSENRSEASLVVCPDTSSYDRSERSSLNVNLYWQELGNGSPSVNVSVNWLRPESATGCAPIGTRGVQLSQVVRLAPGESAEIKGDAGLIVRLTRR